MNLPIKKKKKQLVGLDRNSNKFMASMSATRGLHCILSQLFCKILSLLVNVKRIIMIMDLMFNLDLFLVF